MTSYEIWRNTMIGVGIMGLPVIIVGGFIIYHGVRLSEVMIRPISVFLVMIMTIVIAVGFGAGWVMIGSRECGYIHTHFPVEDHIADYCG